METRHCSRCDTDKPIHAFGKSHKYWCRKCKGEYDVKWRKGLREERRRKFPQQIPGEATCSMCGVSGFEHFPPSFKRKGLTSGYCRKCSLVYYNTKENPDGSRYLAEIQRRLRTQKREYLRNLKIASGCANCGDKRYQVLVFHHVDPSVKLGVLNAMAAQNASWERIEEEVAKCVVLCSNCHRMEHWRIAQSQKQSRKVHRKEKKYA